jgi:Carboxypeptidase regulatory-like domain
MMDQLDRLRIASPCPARWEQMNGDDRARFCELCNLHVYNIAELTAREAKSLIANTEGRICARLYRRSDGTVITKDCPVGLRAIRRRVARIAGAAFATILSLCGGAFGQKKEDNACKQQVVITRGVSDTSDVTGTILDPLGAVVPGTKLTIMEVGSRKSREAESDAEGKFRFSGLAPGVYQLVVAAVGFKSLVVAELKVAAKETANVEAILTMTLDGPLTGVVELPLQYLETSKPGVTIFNEKMIRSLPIP